MNCPKCGEEDLYRDEVDVEVGIIYGPYGCMCGWSENPHYDASNGPSPAQLEESGGRYVDPYGSSHSIDRIATKLEDRFGIPKEITEKVFRAKESK